MDATVTWAALGLVATVPAYFVWKRPKARPHAKRSAPPASERAPGYKPPVRWLGQVKTPIGYAIGNVLDDDNFAVRSNMPPFVVWYFAEDYEGDLKGKGWVSVVDGNPSLPAASPLPNCLQVKRLNMPDGAHHRTLALLSISPEVAAKLNEGPRRQAKITGKLQPEGQPLIVTVSVGTPGASFAPAPTAPAGEHGSSEWQSADSMAARGNIRR